MNNKIIPYDVSGQALHYVIPKELDHHVAERLCRELDGLVDAYQIKELVLDFKDTEFMDSSGIGLVIGRSKTMRFRNGKICVMHLNKRIENIFQSTGLYQLVQVKGE